MDTSALRYDMDTIDVNGVTLRLRITPDMDVSINDYDCYGRYDWGVRDRYSGDNRAPSDFDPERTERLTILNDLVWWERPEHFGDLPSNVQSDFRWMVSQLISFGFSVVTVERLEGTDYYGRPVVMGATSIGGVDETHGDYFAELVHDLAVSVAAPSIS